MALAAPHIVGILSPCSTQIQVNELVPHADVWLVSVPSGNKVRLGKATWTAVRFGLNFSLSPSAQFFVFQELNGESSPTSATGLGVHVVTVVNDPTPSDLLTYRGKFPNVIYACATCVWMDGLFPSAHVDVLVSDAAGARVGTGTGTVDPDGSAIIALQNPLNVGDHLTAWQTACNGAVQPEHTLGGPVVSYPNALAYATIVDPVKCDQWVQVRDIVPGATVILARGNDVWEQCAPIPITYFWNIAPSLQPPQSLVVDQRLVACHNDSGFSNPPTPVADKPSKQPKFGRVLCEGQPDVPIVDLHPGALVEIKGALPGGVSLKFGAENVAADKDVPPLTRGASIAVRQNTCWDDPNTWGPWTTVQVGSGVPVPPSLQAPSNGLAGVSTNPTLSWIDNGTVCNKATSFRIQVDDSPAFTSPIVDVTLAGTGMFISMAGVTLNNQTTYYWHVQPKGGGALWSPTWNFTTVPQGRPGTHDGGSGEAGTNAFCVYCEGRGEYTKCIYNKTHYQAELEMQNRTAGTSCQYSDGPCPNNPICH